MKLWGAVSVSVVIAAITLVGESERDTAPGTEVDNQETIYQELGGEKEYRLNDGTRVDLIHNKFAIEIDWQEKWAEGVGQSIYYAMKLNHQMSLKGTASYKPLVILLTKRKDESWKKYRDRVEFCNVSCWVFDAKTKKWLDKK